MICKGIQGYLFIVVILLFTTVSWSQSPVDILNTEIELPQNPNSISYYVDYLESEYDIVLSFNSFGIDLQRIKTFDSSPQTLYNYIKHLFAGYDYKMVSKSGNKVLLIFSNLTVPKKSITIRGKVYDQSSREILTGATIYEEYSNVSTYTNEYGFYSLQVPADSNKLSVHYIGYTDTVYYNISSIANDFFLTFNNELSVVDIVPSVEEGFVRGVGASKLDAKRKNSATGILGQRDVLELTKKVTGVQSGNEGQTGLYVRGGSPDQNLILLDGIPMYEVSHTLGLSSIFIDEAVRDVSLIKNGFPARYGGRLSSVVNVALKEGNKSKLHGNIDVSPTNTNLHLEGPLIKGKTSYSIAAKKSFLDFYLNDLYTKYTEYDGINIDFFDISIKLCHNFTPTNKISLTYYKGRDDFGLEREEKFINNEDFFNSNVNNEVYWGSEIMNAQYSNVIKDDFFVNFSFGRNNYNFLSRSSYSFESKLGGLSSMTEQYDLRSITEIEDYILSANLDYFANEKHRFKFGGSLTFHNYRPQIQQFNILVEQQPDSMATEDIRIDTKELGLYFEDTYTINDKWEMYLGLHLSGYLVNDHFYKNLQPRLKIIYKHNEKNRLEAAYAQTAQYVHLLVNPGTGLPSDLWVPSTKNIKPETAKQLSTTYTHIFNKNLKLNLGAYLKYMENVLEYKSPVDLIFAVVNQIPTLDDTPWEERVEAGRGMSKGIEFQMDYEFSRLKTWFAYTWSKTDRLFPNLNDGRSFPYKYDRRHDLNFGLQYKINKNIQLTTNWVYGDGHLFSLSLEESVDVGGARIISPGERNNYKLPSFHHLDLMLSYHKKLKENQAITVNVGVYNVYSRLNGFYVYVFENPLEGKKIARKVSIYPILPQLGISYRF